MSRPTLGTLWARDLFGRAQKAIALNAKANIYGRIGVTPIINARGTYTYVSGSLELPEVRAAKEQASLHFWEVQRAAGRRSRLGMIVGRRLRQVLGQARGSAA